MKKFLGWFSLGILMFAFGIVITAFMALIMPGDDWETLRIILCTCLAPFFGYWVANYFLDKGWV